MTHSRMAWQKYRESHTRSFFHTIKNLPDGNEAQLKKQRMPRKNACFAWIDARNERSNAIFSQPYFETDQ